jgi:ornithine cyclodeaminase
MYKKPMLHLSEEEVRGRLDPSALIRALAEAFARLDYVTMPPRSHIELAAGTVLLIMPCDDAALNAAGVKLVSVSRSAGVQATYLLLDRGAGAVRATLAANWLTDARTAATSALATDRVALPNAKTLAIFGTGRLARAHAEIVPLVRRFERILVCGRTVAKSESFVAELRKSATQRTPSTHERHEGNSFAAASAEQCGREADVICTCTTASEPVFRGEWLRRGCHINACGAFQPHTRELDDATMRRARVVVDTYEGALAEAGDLLLPLASGALRRDEIVADLHELVTGKRVRTAGEQVTVFKSVGCAVEDLVAAEIVARSERDGACPVST